jgi:probable HAF family extracellular repeat protein
MAGTYGDQNGNVHGFISRSNTFSSFDFPGAFRTETGQINNRDAIVGDYIDGQTFVQNGFLFQNGQFTSIVVPGQSATRATGINDQGVIVGAFEGPIGEHGFAKIGNLFVTIDFPGSKRADVRGINDAGQIIGTYGDQNGGNHGFLLSNGQFTSIDFPGTFGVTSGLGISPIGIVVGNYFQGTGNGFIDNNGKL